MLVTRTVTIIIAQGWEEPAATVPAAAYGRVTVTGRQPPGTLHFNLVLSDSLLLASGHPAGDGQ